MSPEPHAHRYDAAQVAEAVGRARGDGRWWLVQALTAMPEDQREAALASILDKELRPDERASALAELARLNAAAYLDMFVTDGLRSRSIGTQQVTIMVLSTLPSRDLSDRSVAEVDTWLRRRLKNPRRGSTWATWEVPAAALMLVPSYGVTRVVNLLDSLEKHLQPEEIGWWQNIRAHSGDDAREFARSLEAWAYEYRGNPVEPDPRDPTAEVSVDRTMRRLGYQPVNPGSQVYDSLADFGVPRYTVDATGRVSLEPNT